jgi:hypothetical protein
LVELVGFDAIAELSVALAGFSALLAMFRGGAIHTWHPRARLGFWLIITYSFGSLFFSLFPSLLKSLGSSSWAAPMLALAVYHAAVSSLAMRQNLRLVSSGIPAPSQATWIVATLTQVATVALLLYGVTGGLGGPSYQLYYAGVLVAFLLACVCFVTVLRLREPAA